MAMAISRSILGFSQYAKPDRCCQTHSYSSSPSLRSSRPSIAPKPNIDIKHIRLHPEFHSKNCLARNYKAQSEHPLKIIKLFDEWRTHQRNGRSLREENNVLQAKLSHSKTFSGDEAADESVPEDKESILESARGLKQQIGQIEAHENAINAEIEDLALELPNLTSTETPIGDSPIVLGYINEHPDFLSSSSNRIWRDHVHIANELDLIDFAAAGITSGWGWYYLKNEAALLEQALVQYALQVATQHGFTVVSPPSIVYSHISSACGFRPRDQGHEQQVYNIQQSPADLEKGKPELSLAGTAEIPFASMKANTDMEEALLPLKIIGPSRCYRAEAGGRGVDTKGLYRVHEFTKVEMFGWTLPDASAQLFDTMLAIQTHILQSLGLHCRILEQPTADLGASAFRKRDIEAFFPSRRQRDEGWGEVTSTSICTDYQTRRLATRVRSAVKVGTTVYPHTVNGTAVAVPRVLAALLENGWDEKAQSVRVPEVLWPWMHGVREIGKKRGL